MQGWTSAWLEGVLAAAAEIRAQGLRPAAAFDFDQTCIEGDLGAQFHLELSRLGAYRLGPGSPLRELLRSMPEAEPLMALLDARDEVGPDAAQVAELSCLYTRVLKNRGSAEAAAWAPLLHAGMAEERLASLADRVWTELVSCRQEWRREQAADGTEVRWRRGVQVRPRMTGLIGMLESAGIEVRIVSQTNVWALRAAMQALGLHADRAVGSRVEVEDGRLLPSLRLPTTYREGKVACHAEATGEDASLLLAAGDSENDLALLRAARFAIWVERGDGRHLREAKERGWVVTRPEWLMQAANGGPDSPS